MDLGKLTQLSNNRECKQCGAKFTGDKEHTALEKFCDHITIHQHTVEEWTNAYNAIRRSMGKDA